MGEQPQSIKPYGLPQRSETEIRPPNMAPIREDQFVPVKKDLISDFNRAYAEPTKRAKYSRGIFGEQRGVAHTAETMFNQLVN
jgi:hypothetical protein